MRIALVLARGGSKSIPGKNIYLLNGKPLIHYMLGALADSSIFDAIYVSTDDANIQHVVESFDKNIIIYKRTKDNAKDTSSSEDAILEFLNDHNFDEDTTLVFAQATSPLTTADDLIGGVNVFDNGQFDSVLSVVTQKRFLWERDGTSSNFDFMQRPRRQEFDGYYVENGAFYVTSIGNFYKHNNRLGGKIGFFEMDETNYFELDEISDVAIMEALLERRHENKIRKR